MALVALPLWYFQSGAASVSHRPIRPICTGPLSGRAVAIPVGQAGFGHMQGQPALPLSSGEYVLTIDDGPNPATTQRLLEILREHCVHATFFMIGKKAAANGDLVQAILAEGDGVGSHSMDHRNFATMTTEDVNRDILGGVDTVDKAVSGRSRGADEWRLFRMPGGTGVPLIPSPEMMAFLNYNRLVLAGIDASPEDWRNRPPEQSLATLLPRLRDRGVILVHEGQSNTPALLEMIMSELERRNAKIVTLTLGSSENPFDRKKD